METGAQVWTIKDGYRLGDDIQSKVLTFAFGLSAEIERNLISQRTKEALERKKSEGMILGRPKGKVSNISKSQIQNLKLFSSFSSNHTVIDIFLSKKCSNHNRFTLFSVSL